MSLVGSAGAGFTWSAQGVGVVIDVVVGMGVDVGGSQGVVAVEMLPSMCKASRPKGKALMNLFALWLPKGEEPKYNHFPFPSGLLQGKLHGYGQFYW